MLARLAPFPALANYSSGRENNFNLLRLIAATMVLVSHSYALATGRADLEPLRWLPGFSLGGLAVDIFFIASGFLVTGSLLQRRNLVEFCAARTLRIFPGLWAALLVTVIVVGIGFTTLDVRAFFADGHTWRHVLKNAILVRGISYELPGAFMNVPWPRAVNGSLWTLPLEIGMYAALAISWAVFRAFRMRPDQSLRVFCCVVATIAIGADIASSQPPVSLGLLARFFSGAVLYVLQRRVPASGALFLALLGATLASTLTAGAFRLIYPIAIAYLVIYVALVPAGLFRVMTPRSDYSYGIYIYAFPVQQAIASLWHAVSPIELMASSLVVTLVFAMASWHLVEKRALRWKSVFHQRRPRLAEGTPVASTGGDPLVPSTESPNERDAAS